MAISNQHLDLFQALFKGREDIYARRWKNDDRDGYMPAYNVDWGTDTKSIRRWVTDRQIEILKNPSSSGPRLSVDVDLTYLPIKKEKESLAFD